MDAGLYAAVREGEPACVWVPSDGARTVLVAGLGSDSCRLLAATPAVLTGASPLIRFTVEEPLPYRPGTASEELSGLLGGYLPHEPSALEVAALATSFLRSPVDSPLLDGRLPIDRARNGAVVSEVTAWPHALDLACSRECSEAVMRASLALAEAARESPIGSERSLSEPVGFSYGDYRVDAVLCLTSLRGEDGFEILEGSAGTERGGVERWFNDGVEVTDGRDAQRPLADLDDAYGGLFTMGVTAAVADACPNIGAEALRETVSRAVEEIVHRDGPAARRIV